MSELYTRFDGVFFEKTRLSLLTLLFREEKLSFKALKSKLQLTDGAVYTHLEKLIQGGYVEKMKKAAGLSVQTVYGLTDFGRQEFVAYLDFVRSMILQGEKT